MPQPRYRSGTYQKKIVTTPSHRNVIHYQHRRRATRSCPCGALLTLQTNRPLAGFCVSCMRAVLRAKAWK